MALEVVVLIAIAALCRWHFATWLAPAACVAGFWAIAVALPVLLAPEFGYSSRAIAYLVAAVVVFAVGAYVALPHREERPAAARTGSLTAAPPHEPPPHEPPPHEPPPHEPLSGVGRSGTPLLLLSVAGSLAGLAATGVSLASSGFSVDSVLSLGGLLRAGNSISVQRYEESLPTNLAIPLLLTVVYAAALAAPFARLVGVRSRLIRYAPVLSSAVYSLITTERLVMLTTVALAVGAEATVKTVRGESLRRFGIWLGGLTCLVAGLFCAIAFVRVGSFDASNEAGVLKNLRSYAFGYLAGYSQWFDDYVGLRNGIPTAEPTFFAPLDQLRGAHDLGSTRGYQDGRSFGTDGGTNIFTAVRALVVELGPAGTLFFLAVTGFVTTRWYRIVRRGRGPFAAPALAAFVATVLLSSTQSMFTFTNTCVGVTGGVVIVAFTLRDRGHRIAAAGDSDDASPESNRMRALRAPLPRN